MKINKIYIVGGGISGLTAAYELSKRYEHFDISLFEQFPQIGGKMQAYQIKNGCYAEHGFRIYMEQYSNLFSMFKEIGITLENFRAIRFPIQEVVKIIGNRKYFIFEFIIEIIKLLYISLFFTFSCQEKIDKHKNLFNYSKILNYTHLSLWPAAKSYTGHSYRLTSNFLLLNTFLHISSLLPYFNLVNDGYLYMANNNTDSAIIDKFRKYFSQKKNNGKPKCEIYVNTCVTDYIIDNKRIIEFKTKNQISNIEEKFTINNNDFILFAGQSSDIPASLSNNCSLFKKALLLPRKAYNSVTLYLSCNKEFKLPTILAQHPWKITVQVYDKTTWTNWGENNDSGYIDGNHISTIISCIVSGTNIPDNKNRIFNKCTKKEICEIISEFVVKNTKISRDDIVDFDVDSSITFDDKGYIIDNKLTMLSLDEKDLENMTGPSSEITNLAKCGTWTHNQISDNSYEYIPEETMETACITGKHAANYILKKYNLTPTKLLLSEESPIISKSSKYLIICIKFIRNIDRFLFLYKQSIKTEIIRTINPIKTELIRIINPIKKKIE